MRIAFLGDIALFGEYSIDHVEEQTLLEKFQYVKQILAGYDIVVANLETPMTKYNKSCGGKSAYLKSTPDNIEILKYIGVTHVNLANNHIYDYRERGLQDTICCLEKHGVDYFGINGRTSIVHVGDEMIRLHGYCCYSTNAKGYNISDTPHGINILDYFAVKKALQKDKEDHVLSVLSIHWGQEHVNYPHYDHIKFSRELSKQYAFILHGHHPHVVQGVEKQRDAYIAYSLGNFCFDDVYTKKSSNPLIKLSDNNRLSFIWEIVTNNSQVTSTATIPIFIEHDGIRPFDKQIFSEKMNAYSAFLCAEENTYMQHREKLLKEYLSTRKGQRDFLWYLKRLNIESVKMLWAGYNNRKKYIIHISKQLPRNSIIPEATKKIALICGNFDMVNQNASGRRVFGVGLILRNLGYYPVFIGIHAGGNSEGMESSKTIVQGFPCFSIRKSTSVQQWLQVKKSFQEYLKIIDLIGRDKIELLYLYGSPVLSHLMKKLIDLAHKNKITVLGDCVDWIERNHDGFIKNIAKYIDTNYQKRILLTKTDGIIVISSYLRTYYLSKKKQVLLLPPVGQIYENTKTLVPHNTVKLIYIGIPFSIIPNLPPRFMKDRLDAVVEIAWHLHQDGANIALDIFGISKEDYLTVVPSQRKLLEECQDAVYFNGVVSAVEARQALQNADALILYRDVNIVTTAGFPTKVAESLCCGVPVISTDTSDISTYLKDGYNGLIVNMDSGIAAKEIYNKFICENRYLDMQKNCRHSCIFDYTTYQNSVMQFLKTFETTS